jgi:flagellar biosynthesis chaperone FliJ
MTIKTEDRIAIIIDDNTADRPEIIEQLLKQENIHNIFHRKSRTSAIQLFKEKRSEILENGKNLLVCLDVLLPEEDGKVNTLNYENSRKIFESEIRINYRNSTVVLYSEESSDQSNTFIKDCIQAVNPYCIPFLEYSRTQNIESDGKRKWEREFEKVIQNILNGEENLVRLQSELNWIFGWIHSNFEAAVVTGRYISVNKFIKRLNSLASKKQIETLEEVNEASNFDKSKIENTIQQIKQVYGVSI